MESNDKLEQLLKQMYSEETLHDDDIDTSDIIDEEWTKFEAEHFRSERSDVRGKRIPFLKFAAMIVGILMLSGIAYATIHIVSNSKPKAQVEQTVVAANHPSAQSSQQDTKESTAKTPVVYEDTELASILNDIATFYQVEVIYKSEASKKIRLYFTWDKQQTIDELIDTFNKFERIHMTRDNQKLIVE